MLTAPSEDTIRRYLRLLGTGAIAMIIVIVLGIVLSTVQKSWASLEKQLRSDPIPQYTEGDWAVRTLGDASVEAPFHFGPGADYLAMMSAEDRAVIDFSETYQSLGTPKSFGVMLLRRGLKPPAAPAVDSLRNPLRNIAKAIHDPHPVQSFRPALISGRRAQIATYHRQKLTPDDEEKHVLGAAVVEGNLIWQLVIIYNDEADTPDAERILKSFKIR